MELFSVCSHTHSIFTVQMQQANSKLPKLLFATNCGLNKYERIYVLCALNGMHSMCLCFYVYGIPSGCDSIALRVYEMHACTFQFKQITNSIINFLLFSLAISNLFHSH